MKILSISLLVRPLAWVTRIQPVDKIRAAAGNGESIRDLLQNSRVKETTILNAEVEVV